MNFKYPYEKIGTVPTDLLKTVEQQVVDFETTDAYNFKHGDWLRIDSYHNPDNWKLESIVGQGLIDHVTSFFPDDYFFGWSVSYLPGKKDVVDHADRMMFHRFAKRIIVVLSDTPYVLNWHYSSDKETKRPYLLEYGNIYRLNTAVTHGLRNGSSQDRRAVYFDMMPKRLYNKLKDHPDILKVILMNASGERYVL
jgi:hypothetical protein